MPENHLLEYKEIWLGASKRNSADTSNNGSICLYKEGCNENSNDEDNEIERYNNEERQNEHLQASTSVDTETWLFLEEDSQPDAEPSTGSVEHPSDVTVKQEIRDPLEESDNKKTQEDSEGEPYEEAETMDSDHLHEEIIIKQEPEEEQPPPKKPPLKRPRPRIVRHFVKPAHGRPETVKVIKSTVPHKKDECDSFGEYIAISLRKHDERTRSMIKQAINNILFEQEMKAYNNPQYTLVDMEQNPLLCDDDNDK